MMNLANSIKEAVESKDVRKLREILEPLYTDNMEIEISREVSECLPTINKAVIETAQDGEDAILGLLLKMSVDETSLQKALWLAVQNGHNECVALLLKSGADPDRRSPKGPGEKCTFCIKSKDNGPYLVTNTSSKKTFSKSSKQACCKHFSSQMNCYLRKNLIGHWDPGFFDTPHLANFDVIQTVETTPLFEAAIRGNTQLVRLLINAGCDVEGMNKNRNKFFYQVIYKKRNCFGHVSDLVTDGDGTISPVDIAKEKGHEEVVRFLQATISLKKEIYNITHLDKADTANHLEIAFIADPQVVLDFVDGILERRQENLFKTPRQWRLFLSHLLQLSELKELDENGKKHLREIYSHTAETLLGDADPMAALFLEAVNLLAGFHNLTYYVYLGLMGMYVKPTRIDGLLPDFQEIIWGSLALVKLAEAKVKFLKLVLNNPEWLYNEEKQEEIRKIASSFSGAELNNFYHFIASLVFQDAIERKDMFIMSKAKKFTDLALEAKAGKDSIVLSRDISLQMELVGIAPKHLPSDWLWDDQRAMNLVRSEDKQKAGKKPRSHSFSHSSSRN